MKYRLFTPKGIAADFENLYFTTVSFSLLPMKALKEQISTGLLILFNINMPFGL